MESFETKSPAVPDGHRWAIFDLVGGFAQEGGSRDDYGMVALTLSNVFFTPCPIVPMVAIDAAMTRATITAYSTAVAPSSEPRKPQIFKVRLFIRNSTVVRAASRQNVFRRAAGFERTYTRSASLPLSSDCGLPPSKNTFVPSAARLPRRTRRRDPWLCVPALRLVCLCRGIEGRRTWRPNPDCHSQTAVPGTGQKWQLLGTP